MATKRIIKDKLYRNKRGDLLGSMWEAGGVFFDQYGTLYYPDGTQLDHVPESTGNIDLDTATDCLPINLAFRRAISARRHPQPSGKEEGSRG